MNYSKLGGSSVVSLDSPLLFVVTLYGRLNRMAGDTL